MRILLRAHRVSERTFAEGLVETPNLNQRWIMRGDFHAAALMEKQYFDRRRRELNEAAK